MAWKFLQYFSDSFSAAHLVYAEGKVWAFGTTGAFKVYDYWNTTAANREYLNDMDFIASSEIDRALTVVDSGTVTGSPTIRKIVKFFDKFYITTSTSLIVFDYHTKTVTATKTLPGTFLASFCIAGNKVWFIEQEPPNFATNRRAYVNWYNIQTDTWGSAEIPVRFSSTTQYVESGYLSNIIITSPGTDEVVEFDFNTATFVRARAYAPLVNRILTTEDGQVYVQTNNSFLVQYNQLTDAVTGFSGTRGGNTFFIDSGTGYFWLFNGTNAFTRIKKADKTSAFTPALNQILSPGYELNMPGGSTNYTDVVCAIATPPLTFQEWNGTGFVDRTVKPYMFMCRSGTVYAVRLSGMVRLNSSQVRGAAMVTVGPDDFRGD